MFGVPEGETLSLRLPAEIGEVTSITQLGGEVSDWSASDGRLRLTVPAWADTAVQSLKLGVKG